jgi:cytochrome c peroxidase
MTRSSHLVILAMLLTLATVQSAHAQQAAALTPIEQLGKLLYFDANLSKNSNQSCAACHDPSVGYTGAVSNINAHGAVYPGSTPTLFGNRKPPSAAYAGDSPTLRYISDTMDWIGGMFWDGRADGSVLGDPLAEQAKGPFLNPLEMGLTSPEQLCGKVQAGSYSNLFRQVWGADSLNCSSAAAVYDRIGISIAAYERSAEVNPYTSKFDLFWDTAVKKRLDVTRINVSNWMNYRKLGLSDTELYGLAVFNEPTQANCASCHSLQPGSKGRPLFTNFAYHNLGVPRNPENPFYSNLAYNPQGAAWTDIGLGGHVQMNEEIGKMKVPTLRNVDKRPSATVVKAYAHNGYFKSLADIIRFYAFRAMQGGMGGGGMGGGGMGGGCMGGGGMGGGGMGGMCGGMMGFPAPEVEDNLTPLNSFRCADQSSILAFLKTLSDGYFRR